MTEQVIKRFPYDCTKCNRKINFSVRLNRFSNDEGPIEDTFDEIIGCIGNPICPVLEKVKPRKPTTKEWKECPFYEWVKVFRQRYQ
jgi:hypothetical protein